MRGVGFGVGAGLPVAALAYLVRSTASPVVVLDGQTGYVVPLGDPDALARAVRDLLHDPVLRRSFANRAEKRAVELFSEERLVADHASLYNRLAQRRPVS